MHRCELACYVRRSRNSILDQRKIMEVGGNWQRSLCLVSQKRCILFLTGAPNNRFRAMSFHIRLIFLLRNPASQDTTVYMAESANIEIPCFFPFLSNSVIHKRARNDIVINWSLPEFEKPSLDNVVSRIADSVFLVYVQRNRQIVFPFASPCREARV